MKNAVCSFWANVYNSFLFPYLFMIRLTIKHKIHRITVTNMFYWSDKSGVGNPNV